MEPKASRPDMPGYGILPANEGTGLLPWGWAEDRLTSCRNYFVATVRADGRPHVMPVWGLWLAGAFLFSTGETSRKARNMARDPRCTVCIEGGLEAVIIEGVVETINDASLLARFKDAYKVKYDWDVDTNEGTYYAVRPNVVFGFQESNDFVGSATRWTFGDD